MSAKKFQNGIDSKDIEQMVKKHLEHAFQGDFFKSIHSMRDQQLERIKDLQQKYGDLEQLAFWDLMNKGNTVAPGSKNQEYEKSTTIDSENQSADQMDQMAEQMQQQIQAFVNHVLKVNMEQDS